MNNRERFIRTMKFESVDRPPLALGGGWQRTMARWRREGMPAGVSLYEYFEVEPFESINASPETRIFPAFEQRIVQEDERHIEWINRRGIHCRRRREDYEDEGTLYLEYPVKGGDDRSWLAERLDPDHPDRGANGWQDRLAEADPATSVTILDFGSYYGDLHEHVGTEEVSLLFVDQPDFVHWYNDRIAACVERAIEWVLPDDRLIAMGGHEDMCFKNGPLISPQMFREFLTPYYRRVVGAARAKGQKFFIQDSDGDIRKLIPLWLEVGVNVMSPCEVAAGVDVVALRAEYGKELLMMGGIDKRALAAGPDEIRREVSSKVPAIESGGYIPTVDHGVPPDVSWENYCFYVKTLKEVLGVE